MRNSIFSRPIFICKNQWAVKVSAYLMNALGVIAIERSEIIDLYGEKFTSESIITHKENMLWS